MDKIKSVETPDLGSSLVLSDSTDKNRMTSLEIAEITGKQHAHVMRDIRKLLEQGVSQSKIGLAKYTDKQGKPREMYSLTPKGCLILASGYDALLRECIINRLEQLEKSMTMQPSYQIEDPIARAEAWIAEQKEKKMLKEKRAQQTSSTTRDEIVKSRVRTLNTAEKKRILSRLFPNGYIVRKDDEENELTLAGYTEECQLLEVNFSLFDSRIEIDYLYLKGQKDKWKCISNLINKALGKHNNHSKRQTRFDYDNDSYYFVMEINDHRFLICVNDNNYQFNDIAV